MNCFDAVLWTVQCTKCTPWRHTSTTLLHPGIRQFSYIVPSIQDFQKMDREQLSSYLHLLDLPLQLDSSPHPANLALIQSRHLMRIPYQSRYNSVHPQSCLKFCRDLHNYKNQPRPSLELNALLLTLSSSGGHCYEVREKFVIYQSNPQHSELLYAVLTSLGYSAGWPLGFYEISTTKKKNTPTKNDQILNAKGNALSTTNSRTLTNGW